MVLSSIRAEIRNELHFSSDNCHFHNLKNQSIPLKHDRILHRELRGGGGGGCKSFVLLMIGCRNFASQHTCPKAIETHPK